jgi:hypothetical protein
VELVVSDSVKCVEMTDIQKLRRIYDEELACDPFPSAECSVARITGKSHGELTLYLADIAGLASRGEQLTSLAEPQKSSFRQLASQSLYERCPALRGKIRPARTPKLQALIDATEQARQVIVQTLS